MENFGQDMTFGVLLRPAGERFGNRIEEAHPAAAIGGDDAVPDTAKGGRHDPLALFEGATHPGDQAAGYYEGAEANEVSGITDSEAFGRQVIVGGAAGERERGEYSSQPASEP